MRLLHTADWHIGRITMGVSRKPDLQSAVQEVITIAREDKPDLIIHAGDLFDAIRPGWEDLQWGVDALRELAAIAPTVVLCGNHDSPQLFEFLSRLLPSSSNLRFIPKALPPAKGGIVEIELPRGQVVRLAPIPFIHQNRFIDGLEDEPAQWMANYADRVAAIQSELARGLEAGYDPARHVLLLAAHLHVTGAHFSKNSQRQITVSDTYATRGEQLPAVSYAAYGHIHQPQQLPGVVLGRYAGSIIPIDLGEEGEQKEVVLVDAEPGRAPEVTIRKINGGRVLRRIEGTLDDIAAMALKVGDSLCFVVAKTERTTPDLSERIRALMPDATFLGIHETADAQRVAVLSSEDVSSDKEPGFSELFRDFLRDHPARAGSAATIAQLFDSVLTSVQLEEVLRLAPLERLEAAAREAKS
jgi:exonuclease SbcD